MGRLSHRLYDRQIVLSCWDVTAERLVLLVTWGSLQVRSLFNNWRHCKCVFMSHSVFCSVWSYFEMWLLRFLLLYFLQQVNDWFLELVFRKNWLLIVVQKSSHVETVACCRLIMVSGFQSWVPSVIVWNLFDCKLRFLRSHARLIF